MYTIILAVLVVADIILYYYNEKQHKKELQLKQDTINNLIRQNNILHLLNSMLNKTTKKDNQDGK